MDSKKFLQIVAILVAGVWIATIGTVIVVKTVKPRQQVTVPVPQTVVTTTQPSTTLSPETMPVGGNNVITTARNEVPSWKQEEEASISASIEQSKQQASAQNSTQKVSIVPSGKANIISAYVKGINNLKNTQNFSLVEDAALTIAIDEVTGGSVVQGLAEKFVTDNQATEPIYYTFVGGVDASTGNTPNAVIPPLNRTATLNESAVTSASARENSDGGYTVTIKLNSEKQTNTAEAANHAGIVSVIDMSELMISGASVEAYEITYSDTTITAVFDKDNRIVSLRHYMSVPSASGNGKYTVIPVEMAMHGEYTGSFDITY